MKRLTIALLLVLLASCTRDVRRAGPRSSEPTARAAATSSPGAVVAGEASPGTSPGATGAVATGTGRPAGTASAPGRQQQQSTAPDGANIPKPGTYVYSVSSGQAPPQDVSIEVGPGRAVTGGTEVTVRIGQQATLQRWERARVVLLRLVISTSDGDVECRFNTSAGGIEVAHFPYREETFPRQEWLNDQCRGSHEQQVLGRETITVRGRTWDTWKVVSTTRLRINLRTETGTEEGDFTARQTQWVVPDLGVDVKTDSTNQSDGSSFQSTRELAAYPA